LVSIYWSVTHCLVYKVHTQFSSNGFGSIYVGEITNVNNLDYIEAIEGYEGYGQKFDGINVTEKVFQETTYFMLNSFKENANKIPKNLAQFFPRLTGISWTSASLESITVEDLKQFPELFTLNVNSNELTTLEDDLFKYNQKLLVAYFYNNKVENLGKDLLANLFNLNQFAIAFNQLTTLHGDFFKDNRNLTQIILTSNMISHLDVNLLRNLNELYYLDVSENRLTIIDGDLFKDNAKLEDINFNNNLISYLHVDLFSGLSKLRILNIEGNQLTVIDGDLFKFNTKLQVAKFNNNSIEHVGAGLLTHFKNLTSYFEISFENNPCLASGNLFVTTKEELADLESNLLTNCPQLPTETTTDSPQQCPATCSSRLETLEEQNLRYEERFVDLERMIRELS
jgi:Leucine-rich repeat (LRR) protein